MNDMNDASGGWDSWARQLQAGQHERPEKKGPVLLFRLHSFSYPVMWRLFHKPLYKDPVI